MKQRTKHFLIAFLCLLSLLALSLSLAACGIIKKEKFSVTIADYDTTNGKVTLSPKSEDGMYEKDTELTVTVEAYAGYALDTFTLSTDANAALDSESKFVFKVTADTTITVTFKSTVVPVESVTLGSNTLELEVGGRTEDATATLVANVQPDNATDKTVTWTSSNPAVATVEGGNVTALTAGETTITATAGGKSATCTVTVTQHNHNFGAWVDEVPATCVATGTKAHKQCTLCEKNFDNTDKEITELTIPVDANAHRLVAQVGEEGHWQECDRDGCDYKGNVTPHNFNGAMVNKGETGHANKCSVEGCTYESAVTAHTLKINDDKTKFECEQCEYEVAHTHNLDTVSAGESGHKDVCKTEGCGYESAVTAHSLKINDGKTKFECEQCEYEVDHTHKLELNNVGESGHKEVCKTEGCGYEGEVTAHTAKDDKYYQNDEKTKHYQLCECNAHVNEDDHFATSWEYDTGDMTTGQHYQVCEDCHLQFNIGSHQKSEKAEGTDAGHHYTCTVCPFVGDDESHTGEPADGEWKVDSTASGGHRHYYICSTCDFKVSKSGALHPDYTRADGEYQGCEKCGFSERVRDHKLYYVQDDNGMHHAECENKSIGCTYKTESESCKDAVDQEGKSTITWTQATEDPSTGHTGKCVCGNDIALEAHDTLGTDGACSKCGYVAGHTHKDETAKLMKDGKELILTGYKDGLCDGCGQQLDDAIWEFNNTGTITKFTGDATYTKVVVPTQIGNQKISGVKGNSSSIVFKNNENITHIIIPEGIALQTTGGEFSGCKALQSAMILGKFNTDALLSNAFKDCKALTTLVLSASFTSLHDRLFGSTASISKIDIYFLGTSEAWSAMVNKLTANGAAKKVIEAEGSSVLFYSSMSTEDGWHWKDSTDSLIPEKWN